MEHGKTADAGDNGSKKTLPGPEKVFALAIGVEKANVSELHIGSIVRGGKKRTRRTLYQEKKKKVVKEQFKKRSNNVKSRIVLRTYSSSACVERCLVLVRNAFWIACWNKPLSFPALMWAAALCTAVSARRPRAGEDPRVLLNQESYDTEDDDKSVLCRSYKNSLKLQYLQHGVPNEQVHKFAFVAVTFLMALLRDYNGVRRRVSTLSKLRTHRREASNLRLQIEARKGGTRMNRQKTKETIGKAQAHGWITRDGHNESPCGSQEQDEGTWAGKEPGVVTTSKM
ncbi:hypothetical protein ANN_19700 [Periplaneta americana]|uniref:Uncharacterized protein n=1 Tax=Periplaneta americana TaxID=6978 RepID=A0ABQ8SB97_PERAM|nr:hypothetical protein ANN_19700 [Periplaneta americana]